MSKVVYTHFSTFHADEVTAIALLKVFKPDDYKVYRVQHQITDFADADYIIDVGREYDNKTRFDHHQWQGGLSSAGLIWKHINLEGYGQIDGLIEAVDHNDVGIKPATPYEYSRLISTYNHADTHSDGQYLQFEKAVAFAVEVVTNMKNSQERINASQLVCKEAPLWPGTSHVLELPKWCDGWSMFVNGSTMPEIEAVVWPDEKLGTWNIQTTVEKPGSYKKNGRLLLPYSKMDFVHAANFFAVAKSKDLMDEYIHNYMKGDENE